MPPSVLVSSHTVPPAYQMLVAGWLVRALTHDGNVRPWSVERQTFVWLPPPTPPTVRTFEPFALEAAPTMLLLRSGLTVVPVVHPDRRDNELKMMEDAPFRVYPKYRGGDDGTLMRNATSLPTMNDVLTSTKVTPPSEDVPTVRQLPHATCRRNELTVCPSCMIPMTTLPPPRNVDGNHPLPNPVLDVPPVVPVPAPPPDTVTVAPPRPGATSMPGAAVGTRMSNRASNESQRGIMVSPGRLRKLISGDRRAVRPREELRGLVAVLVRVPLGRRVVPVVLHDLGIVGDDAPYDVRHEWLQKPRGGHDPPHPGSRRIGGWSWDAGSASRGPSTARRGPARSRARARGR